MPGITFVFGPNGSFFFDSPTAWKFDRIPGTLRQLFQSSMGPSWRIAQPYCVALAPQTNSSPEPLWYIGCKVMTGEDKLFYSQTYFEINYTDLVRWTKTLPNASSACFVTFGLNMSYFASAHRSGSIWAGIPSELEDRVRKSFETPSCVALGAHDAWFVLWPSGDCYWKLSGHYSGLDKALIEAGPRSVSYVALSPYDTRHYFVAFRDQSIKYDFTGAPPEWMKLMTEVFDAWQAERLQKPQQQHCPLPGFVYPQAQPYQPYQSCQPYQPLQHQQQAAYYYNNAVAELPISALPMSPPLTPVELPGDMTLAAPARTTLTEKKKRFKLF